MSDLKQRSSCTMSPWWGQPSRDLRTAQIFMFHSLETGQVCLILDVLFQDFGVLCDCVRCIHPLTSKVTRLSVSKKTEIRTNSVTCTTATGYATFHRTCGLPCRQKWRTARITLPQEPSRVALWFMYSWYYQESITPRVCNSVHGDLHGGIPTLHQKWRTRSLRLYYSLVPSLSGRT